MDFEQKTMQLQVFLSVSSILFANSKYWRFASIAFTISDNLCKRDILYRWVRSGWNYEVLAGVYYHLLGFKKETQEMGVAFDILWLGCFLFGCYL